MDFPIAAIRVTRHAKTRSRDAFSASADPRKRFHRRFTAYPLTLQAPPLTKKASRTTLFRLPGNGKSVIADAFFIDATSIPLSADAFSVERGV
jgi:hypothetical protein